MQLPRLCTKRDAEPPRHRLFKVLACRLTSQPHVRFLGTGGRSADQGARCSEMRRRTKNTPASERILEISNSPSSVYFPSRLPRLTSMKLPLLISHTMDNPYDPTGVEAVEMSATQVNGTYPLERETSTPLAVNHSRVDLAASPSLRLFSPKNDSSHCLSVRIFDQTASDRDDTA